jgi:hypothetical protein
LRCGFFHVRRSILDVRGSLHSFGIPPSSSRISPKE